MPNWPRQPMPPRAARLRARCFRCRTRRSSPTCSRCTNRDTRNALFEASWNRAEGGGANDTRATIARLAQLRAQKAKLLGYPELRGLETDRPDGQDAGGGAQVHGCAGAGRNREGGRRGQGHPGPDRRAEWRIQARALGLELLFRAGAQGEVRSGRVADQALLRAEQRAPKWRVLRSRKCSTASPSNSAPTFPSTTPTCRCTRFSTQTASRWRCGTATTSSATTRTAERGWTSSSASRSCWARCRWSTTSPTSPSPPRASRR